MLRSLLNPVFESIKSESVSTESLDIGTSTNLPISDPERLEDERDFDTEYQNISGQTNLITVRVRNDSVGEDFGADIFLRSSPGVVGGGRQIDGIELVDIDGETEYILNFLVPDGHYYEVRDRGGPGMEIRDWSKRGI